LQGEDLHQERFIDGLEDIQIDPATVPEIAPCWRNSMRWRPPQNPSRV
jgi:hypothetical protein